MLSSDRQLAKEAEGSRLSTGPAASKALAHGRRDTMTRSLPWAATLRQRAILPTLVHRGKRWFKNGVRASDGHELGRVTGAHGAAARAAPPRVAPGEPTPAESRA